ncbi:MAG: hypothetical protein WBM40_04490 [Thiohalocapsa sp.]
MPRQHPKRRIDIDAELGRLEGDTDASTLHSALAHDDYRMLARAAEVAGERLCYELEPALIAAFRRLASADHKRDPGCLGKGAIARALVALDCLDAGFFYEGMALRQPEPVWGGTVDTAADVRASCAMGLAASGAPRALIALVDLLADPEHRARGGAVRAIACTEPLAATAVLRTKVLLGDDDPDVIGECLRGLLSLEPDASPAFVARLLDHDNLELAELAALALGESRLDAAVAELRAEWERQPLKRPRDLVLLRAATLARTESAFAWLLQLIRDANTATAAFLIAEMAVYRGNQRLTQRIAEQLEARGDTALLRDFAAQR